MKGYQLPYHRSATERASARKFVKQVLPLGEVDHPTHGKLEFTPDEIAELVRNFEAGAMDMVPFTLVNDANEHNDDPERIRGEVKALEARANGLYATLETGERGAQLIEDAPNLPVSVRILKPTTGPFAGRSVLGHVAATPDPVARGMAPWQRLEAAAEHIEITDFSDGVIHPSDEPPVIPEAGHGRPAGEMAETETTTLTDEDQGLLKRFADRLKARGNAEEENPELTDEQVDEILADVLKDAEEATSEAAETETETETEEEAAEVAALSAEDRKAIDLANSRAEQASKDAAAARAEANSERFKRESLEMKRAGIPPAAIDLARPVLEHGLPEQIDLSNGEKVDGAKIVRGLLDQMKGTVDFSEVGSTDGEGTEAAEAKDLAKRMGEQYGDPPKKAES